MAALFLAEIVVGGAVAMGLAAHFHHHRKPLPWWVPVAVIGGEVLLIAIEWAVIVTIHRRRHGTWLPEPAAVLGADKPVRKRVGKAFRKGRLPQDRVERALAVDLATKAMRLRWMVYVGIVIVVLAIPTIAFDHRTPTRVSTALTAVLWLMIVGLYALILRRARRIRSLAERTDSQRRE